MATKRTQITLKSPLRYTFDFHRKLLIDKTCINKCDKNRTKQSQVQTGLKGEVSREFGVISETPKHFLINKNLNVLLKFFVDCYPIDERPGHRWTGLERNAI